MLHVGAFVFGIDLRDGKELCLCILFLIKN